MRKDKMTVLHGGFEDIIDYLVEPGANLAIYLLKQMKGLVSSPIIEFHEFDIAVEAGMDEVVLGLRRHIEADYPSFLFGYFLV